MAERRDDLIDESVLRRSLRFEADEQIPRFDAVAIAVRARPHVTPAVLLGGIVAAAAIGLTASALWSIAAASVPFVRDEAIALAIDTLASAASLLYPLVQVATDPAVPLSLLAALGAASYHEMRTRREHANVHAS